MTIGEDGKLIESTPQKANGDSENLEKASSNAASSQPLTKKGKGAGTSKTKQRNKRKQLQKKLLRLKSNKILPEDANLATMKEWMEENQRQAKEAKGPSENLADVEVTIDGHGSEDDDELLDFVRGQSTDGSSDGDGNQNTDDDMVDMITK